MVKNKDIILIAAGALAFLTLQPKTGGGGLSESGGLGDMLGGLPTITPSGGGGADSVYVGIDAPNPVMTFEPIPEPTPEPTPTKKEKALEELPNTPIDYSTSSEPSIVDTAIEIVKENVIYGGVALSGYGAKKIEAGLTKKAAQKMELSASEKIALRGAGFVAKTANPLLNMLIAFDIGDFAAQMEADWARENPNAATEINPNYQLPDYYRKHGYGETKKEIVSKSPTPYISSYGGAGFFGGSGSGSGGYVSIENAFRDVPVSQRSQKIIDAMNAQNQKAATKKEAKGFSGSF